MVLVEALLLIVVLIFLLYKWATAGYDTLKVRRVPHDAPIPLLGNVSWRIFRGKASLIEALDKWHQQNKANKIYGIYQLRNPLIFIRDLDLIKRVTIKDFDKFANRKPMSGNIEDNIFAKSLIALNDQQWREMRNTLTPTFTGSKLRIMFDLMNECCMSAVQHIELQMQSADTKTMDIEMKDYFTRFANDVIASAVFGIRVNSFENKSNEFYVIGRKLTRTTPTLIAKAILISLFPKVMKLLGVTLGDQEKVNYFKSIVFDAIKYRTAHDIIRPDMIHLLIEAKRQFDANKNDETRIHATFNDEDILAQCLLFFFAGFETVSTCLSFTTYELTMNPEKQQLLYEEIQQVENTLNGQPLNYDVLTKMKYMDMVISESLRKWPPAVTANRVCSVDHKLIDNDDNVVVELKKGDLVYFPIYGLHHDPENFPDPLKYIPERFSEENRHAIKSLSYMPFGAGPRNCIGNRLALMETKAIIYHLFRKFKFIPHANTPENMLDVIKGFNLQPKTFWLKATARN